MSGEGEAETGRALAIQFYAALCDYHDGVDRNFVEEVLDCLRYDEMVKTSDNDKSDYPQYFDVYAENIESLATLVNAHTINDEQIENAYQLKEYSRSLEKTDISYYLTRLALEKYECTIEFDSKAYAKDDAGKNKRRLNTIRKEFRLKRWYPKPNRRKNIQKLAEICTKASKSLNDKRSAAKESEPFINWIISRIKDFQWRNPYFHITSKKLKEDYQWNEFPLVDLGLVGRKKENRTIIDRVSQDSIFGGTEQNEVVKQYQHETFLEEVLGRGKTPKGFGRSIIVGEPGAGKTTLLQQIHRTVLDKQWGIPIWIPLKALEPISAKDDGEKLLHFIYKKWLKDILNESCLTKLGKKRLEEEQEDLRDLFLANTERIWLLLDGLDEMTVTGAQSSFSAIQKQIDNLKELSPYRIILTCRENLWNSYSINDIRDFDSFAILKFTPTQVKHFIENWFNWADKAQCASDLSQRLEEHQNQNLRYLVCNPLLLTMLCLVYEKGDDNVRNTLPRTRATLYRQFIQDCYRWNKDEFQIRESDRSTIENDILPEVALWNFENGSSLHNLPEDKLKDFLKDRFRWTEIELDTWMQKLENTWLQKVGFTKHDSTQAAYCFFHRTFQEYFAAKAIDDWDFFIPRSHIDKPIKGKKYRIFDDRWLEVILFWIGRREVEIKSKEKKLFLQSLCDFDDGIGSLIPKDKEGISQFLYRDKALFIAGACTGETKSKLNRLICSELLKPYLGYDSLFYHRDIFYHYPKLIYSLDRSYTVEFLIKEILNSHKNTSAKLRAAAGLIQIEPENQYAIDFLTDILQSSKSSINARISAAQVLVQIDSEKQDAINFLIENIRMSSNDCEEDSLDSLYNAATLASIDPENQYAINFLIERTYDLCITIRSIAIRNLVRVASGNKLVINTFTKILQDPQDTFFRSSSLAADLIRIDPKNQYATEVLCKEIENQQKSIDARISAAEGLVGADLENQYAIDFLTEVLLNHQIEAKTVSIIKAALCLGILDPGNELAISSLITILQGQDDTINAIAALYLDYLDPGNELAISSLIKEIQDTHPYHTFALNTFEKLIKSNLVDYPRIYFLFRYYRVSNQSDVDGEKLLKVNSTGQIFSFLVNIAQLKDETSEATIVQQIYNQIYKNYKNELADYLEPTISKVTTWSDLDTWLLNLSIQLPQTDLALVLENCTLNPELIDILEKIATTVHICCITDTIVESSAIFTISSQSPDLQSEVVNWLEKLDDKLKQ